MSTCGFDDIDLSDEWVEQQQPPTIRLSKHGSLSGSVNILSEKTNDWSNANHILMTDLLSKRSNNSLQSLFMAPPECQQEGDHHQADDLSTVEEATSEEEHALIAESDSICSLRRAAHDIHDMKDQELQNKENSQPPTFQNGTARSAEGLIPNFSFPRNSLSTQQQLEAQPDTVSRSPQIESVRDESFQDQASQNTPRRSSHKHTGSSPSKSPLKIFQDPDTFTQDRMGQLIGLLGGGPPPMADLNEVRATNPQKSQQSTVSAVSEMTDSGPNRKKVKTHEPKGSVTLQNMYDNAARMAAKLKAKGGGLGKGLPRTLEESNLSRKASGPRAMTGARQVSGFEEMNIPVDRFVTGPKFGITTSKSHFSDWDSVANTESRAVSASTITATPGGQQKDVNDDELAAESIQPRTVYETIKQTWTQTPGRINANKRPSTAPASRSPTHSHRRSADHGKSQSNIQNFPPMEMRTLRQGDMVFSHSRQCWRHVDEANDLTSPKPKSSHQETESESQYPDEIEISLSASNESHSTNHFSDEMTNTPKAPAKESTMEIDTFVHDTETDGDSGSLLNATPRQSHGRTDSAISISEAEFNMPLDADLVEQTANMSMSRSTAKLVQALNTRYGTGPWENVQRLDLHSLGLESLVDLHIFFPNLISLDISDNTIAALDGLPESLQVLHASRNRIASHRASFDHLKNLQELDLAQNQIEDLDGFAHLIHLRHLNLNENHLVCIDGLRNLSNLISFEAQGNMLQEVDFIDLQAYAQLRQLERLDLSRNLLTRVLGLDSLESLISLDMSRNRLEELDIQERLEHLKVLKVTHNALRSIDTTFFSRIRVLYLDDNEIEHVETPTTLKYIETLSLRRQRVREIDFDLSAFHEAQKLYLGGNELPQIRFSTPFLSLKYLELAGTQMHQLPLDLAKLAPNLRVLNLSNNRLTDLSPLVGLDRLERLLVPNNRIASAQGLADVLCHLSRLKAFDVRANTFTANLYAPIHADQEVDYFAHLDGSKSSAESMQAWQAQDANYSATLTPHMKRRKEAYQSLVWSVCRALRWHDGSRLETQQLVLADEYVDSFTHESLLDPAGTVLLEALEAA